MEIRKRAPPPSVLPRTGELIVISDITEMWFSILVNEGGAKKYMWNHTAQCHWSHDPNNQFSSSRQHRRGRGSFSYCHTTALMCINDTVQCWKLVVFPFNWMPYYFTWLYNVKNEWKSRSTSSQIVVIAARCEHVDRPFVPFYEHVWKCVNIFQHGNNDDFMQNNCDYLK